MSDLRLAIRTLSRTPAYTLTVVLTLTLGIGGATAVYSILHSVILRPIPYAPSDRVMLLAERDSAANIRLPSYPTFQDWTTGTDAFEAMAFARGLSMVMRTGDHTERLVGTFVSDGYFRVLPEQAAVGRALEPADYAPGTSPVVVLSWHLWQRGFGADRAALGRSVILGDQAYTVVGVMPAGIRLSDVGRLLCADHRHSLDGRGAQPTRRPRGQPSRRPAPGGDRLGRRTAGALRGRRAPRRGLPGRERRLARCRVAPGRVRDPG